MPVAAPSSNPFRNPRLADGARQGVLIELRCGLCRRRATFWAADLARVVGGDHPLHRAPFPCARCRTAEYLDVRWYVPAPSTLPGITVRRPVRQVVRWLWQDGPAG